MVSTKKNPRVQDMVVMGSLLSKRGRHDVEGDDSNEGRHVPARNLRSHDRRYHKRCKAGCTGQCAAHVGDMELDEVAGRDAAWL